MTAVIEKRESKRDTDLKRRILIFFSQRHVPALRRVEIEVQDGTVEIKGHVNSFYEKQLCLSCCQRVAGVVRIVDLVEVAM